MKEIKEGDWFLDISFNNYGLVYKSAELSKSSGYENWVKTTTNIIKEPKQHLIDIMRGDDELGLYEEPKKETLEEAAKKYGREQPFQELFDYLKSELNVIALLTELQEIEAIINDKQKQHNMKARLEFDLNEAEDRMSLKRSVMSLELTLALWKIYQELPKEVEKELKFNEETEEKDYLIIETINKFTYDVLSSYGIDLDSLIN
jgi:hypothetical protein